jgi:hypothetical protein
MVSEFIHYSVYAFQFPRDTICTPRALVMEYKYTLAGQVAVKRTSLMQLKK